jgi:hypothetical protein
MQFPQRTVNVLFVFHHSLAESAKYIQQSLFGESTFFMEPTAVCLQEDGLFATDTWRAVSACYLSGASAKFMRLLAAAQYRGGDGVDGVGAGPR